MKFNFKNILKIGSFILGVSIILIGCQKESVDSLEEASEITVKIIDFNQIKSNNKAISKLQKLSKGKNLKSSKLNRDIFYNEEYGFSINTDYVKYVEKEDYHSYSFSIIRDEPNDERLENLLLSLNEDGTYSSYIVTYGFTKEEFNTLDNELLNSRTTHYQLIDFDSSFLNKNSQSKTFKKQPLCIEVWILVQVDKGDEGELVGAGNESPAEFAWVLESSNCFNGGGGGIADGGEGTTGSSSGTTGGGNSGGSGAGGAIITSPINPDGSSASGTFVANLLGDLLTDDKKKCIRDSKNTAFANQAQKYLADNQNSTSAMNFVAESNAVNCSKSGEVDFENEIIKDSSFIGTKADCVLNALIASGNNLFKKTSQAFTDGKSKFKLRFTTYNDSSDEADARTGFPSSGDIITIRFNLVQTRNSPAMDLARSIFHESIHAELHRIKIEGNVGPNPLPTSLHNWYIQMWSYYQAINDDEFDDPYKVLNETATDTQHNLMAFRYISPIASGLQEFDEFHMH